ncbi:E3 ubiquitin-protein ligase TRIM21-like [Gouania willdenowi]|uniref:E3 ubiquitin-protein ligase TRIM21-like n=1 Tax=Gouania willdenowi TaxID=441366 RepID=UPI0010545C44|nr:E3 ubiquitin-protein ligase TRIM21-like [Gouania willdenowi]
MNGFQQKMLSSFVAFWRKITQKKEKPKKEKQMKEKPKKEKQKKQKPKKEKKKKQEKKKQCVGMSEHYSLCSICQKMMTDPVSTPCGHNFCKSCISTHWDTSVSYTCPVCKKEFTTRPPIAVNNLVSQMVSVLRRELAAPEEVSKVKAVRSCQDIETYLTEPVQNLETKMCLKHSEPLDMFCKTDQTCVCSTCCDSEHSDHVFVSLEKESGERVEELQQMIQERQEYKKEIMKLMNTADSQKGEGVELSTAVNELVQRCLTMLTETVKEQQISKKGEADAVIKELVDEYFELMKRKYEAEQLFRPEDRFQLFQHVQSPLPATKDYTEVIVHLSSYEETALTVAAQMKDQIRDKLKMKRMKQFAVDVTFDPLTAYNKLNLSDDRKQVHMSDVKNNVPDNPERFYPCANVLGKQSFSSGKFYYEVLVEGKTDWTLGVVKKSIKRKGNVTLSPKNGCWIVVLREGNKYVACENPSIILHLKCVPKKVGVFVDYEGGVISFYDVGAAALIYSFTNCSFTYKLRPFFSPCLKNDNNAAPLIICPVSQSDEVL